MKRILFVDENHETLQTLEEMFNDRRKIWNMTFVDSPTAAIDIMNGEGGIDLVAVDIRMESLDGLDFLSTVKAQSPQITRFALGEAEDGQQLLDAANLAHQFVEKPYDAHDVRSAISRALALRERLHNCPLREDLLKMGAIPTLPALYGELMDHLDSPDVSVGGIAELISKDVAISAKVLQVVNSSAAGRRRAVSNISEAADSLGLEKLTTIIRMVEAFTVAEEDALPEGFSLDTLWQHSLTVAEYAKKIAEESTDDPRVIDASFTGGLLHDIGMIILAANMPELLCEALVKARETDVSLYDAEKEVFNATHTEVGGFLLDLWGLPDPIVEATTFHDFPVALPEEEYFEGGVKPDFRPLTAVHVANCFCEDERREAYGCTEADVDNIYLERHGYLELTDEWWKLCMEG